MRLELPDRTHLIGLNHAVDVNNWLRIIRRSKKTHEEVLRTEDSKLRKNVDKIVWMFRQKKANEILAYCNGDYDLFGSSIRIDKTKPQSFLKIMKIAQFNSFDVTFLFTKILDAIQAHRPYYEELMHMVMENNHERWTEIL